MYVFSEIKIENWMFVEMINFFFIMQKLQVFSKFVENQKHLD